MTAGTQLLLATHAAERRIEQGANQPTATMKRNR